MAADNNTSTFTIVLDGKQLTAGADQAESALSKLRDELRKDEAEISRLQKAMKAMQQGSVVNVQEFKRLQSQLNAKKSAVAQNTTAYVGLGGKLEDLKAKAVKASGGFAELTSKAQALPGPLGQMAGQLSRVSALGLGLVAASVAAAAAIVAINVAVIKATKALYEYGVAQAEAARNERIHLENLTKTPNWYGIAAGKADDLVGAIDRVSSASVQSRSKITSMAESLYKAGFRGENLADALEGFATKSAVQGEQHAQMWLGYAKAVNYAGGSVKKMSETVKQQLGGQVQKQMLSTEVQAEKLKESYASLFGKLKIDGLLKAKKTFNDLFSQSTESGKALRQLLGFVVQPLVNAAEAGWQVMRRVFQGMILAALDVEAAFLKFSIFVREHFGNLIPKKFDATWKLVSVGKIAFYALLGVVGLAVAAAGALAAAFATVAVPIGLAVTAVAGVTAGLVGLVAFVFGTDWAKLGSDIWAGFLSGLEKGWKAVSSFFSTVGEGIKNTFANVLQIKSPSKVFEGYGENITEGLALGMEAGKPEVDQTVRHLVNAPEAPPAAAASSSGERSAGVSITFGNIIVQGGDAQAAQSTATAIVTEIEKRLTDVALEMGLAV